MEAAVFDWFELSSEFSGLGWVGAGADGTRLIFFFSDPGLCRPRPPWAHLGVQFPCRPSVPRLVSFSLPACTSGQADQGHGQSVP